MSLWGLTLLRPAWLLLLLVLPLVLWWRRRHPRPHGRGWAQDVDAHLLPHLLVAGAAAQPSRHWLTWLPLPLAALLILALAGPSWRSVPAPLWQAQAPLVVVMDLSSAMRTADLPPDRLTQAKARVRELLKARRDGQVGLLVYADDAFEVAPLTPDGRTLEALLDSLQPDIMPVDGQQAARALQRAGTLLQASGTQGGDVLLLTDRVTPVDIRVAGELASRSVRISVLGVGTAAGAPRANRQGFVTDARGQVQLSRLDEVSLRALAQAGGGRYAALDASGADLRQLGVLETAAGATLAQTAGQEGMQAVDEGYWLLLPALLLGWLGFWRGGWSSGGRAHG